MKVTISSNDVMQSLYARSSLRAMAEKHPDGLISFMLTPDNADALLRVVRDSFTCAAFMVGTAYIETSSEQYSATYKFGYDDLDPETVAPVLTQATILVAEYIMLGANGEPNIESILKKAKFLLSSIRSKILHIHPD